MKVNRGRKVRLVTATSHFVVLWLLLIKFKCRYIVSGYRFDTAMYFRLFVCIMVCGCVILFLQCSISSRNQLFHRFVVSSIRYVVSSLRMNRVDLGTILTTLNMAAMEHGATSDELKQGRNEVYGIRDQGTKKGWDPGSQLRDLGSQPRDRDQQCFLLDQGSGVLDQQNFAG